jgi:hypothetical protein
MEEYLPIAVAGAQYYIRLEGGREPVATRNWEPDPESFGIDDDMDEFPPPYYEGEI